MIARALSRNPTPSSSGTDKTMPSLVTVPTSSSVTVGLSPVIPTRVAQSGISHTGTGPAVTSTSVHPISAFPNIGAMSGSPQFSVPEINVGTDYSNYTGTSSAVTSTSVHPIGAFSNIGAMCGSPLFSVPQMITREPVQLCILFIIQIC